MRREHYHRDRYREMHGLVVRPCGRATGPRPRKYCYTCTLEGCYDTTMLALLRENESEYHRERYREYYRENLQVKSIKPCGRIKTMTVRDFCHECTINDCEVWE